MAKTDRELLELAAKAAGIPITFGRDWYDQGVIYAHGVTPWSPLTDDGDALRLAVKLGLHLTPSAADCWATHLKVTAIEPLGIDPYAAARRAIVRAAAEIATHQEQPK